MSTSSNGLQGASAPPGDVVVTTVNLPPPSQEPLAQEQLPPPPSQIHPEPIAQHGRFQRLCAGLRVRLEQDLGYKGFSVPEFDSTVSRQRLCCFRATERWQDSASMWNGESSMKRFAMLRATRVFVYADAARKPIVVLCETEPQIIKGDVASRVQLRPSASSPASWSDDAIMAFESTVTHVLSTRDLAKVTSAIDEVASALDALKKNVGNQKAPRYQITRYTLELSRPYDFRSVQGGTLCPESLLIARVPRRRMTLKLDSTSRQVDSIIQNLSIEAQIQHVHVNGNQIRLITTSDLTHQFLNTLSERFSVRVFADDFLPRPSTPSSEAGLSSSSAGAPLPKRYSLQAVTGGIIPEAVLATVLTKFLLERVKSKNTDLTRFLLQATAQTPALNPITPIGTKLVLEELEPRSEGTGF